MSFETKTNYGPVRKLRKLGNLGKLGNKKTQNNISEISEISEVNKVFDLPLFIFQKLLFFQFSTVGNSALSIYVMFCFQSLL